MGKNEASSSSDSERESSPVQTFTHGYPDWAAIQTYYGPGFAFAPFFSNAVAPGHAPCPYMWLPQHLMTHFGTPYLAIYPPGVHPHITVPFASGSNDHYQGIAPSPTTGEAVVMSTTLSIDAHLKPSSDKGKLLVKKLEGLHGLSMSVTSFNADNTTGGAKESTSQSGECGREDSSDGSHENNDVYEMHRSPSKNSLSEKDAKSHMSTNARKTIVTSENSAGDQYSSILSDVVTKDLDSLISSAFETKAGAAPVMPSANTIVRSQSSIPHEFWIQDEREAKREKRKQSNRDSARRSRLRKQAETEELNQNVESLISENSTIRSEINKLLERMEKLRQENTSLMEKIGRAQVLEGEEATSECPEGSNTRSANTANLLLKLSGSSSSDDIDADIQENPRLELRPLLDTKS